MSSVSTHQTADAVQQHTSPPCSRTQGALPLSNVTQIIGHSRASSGRIKRIDRYAFHELRAALLPSAGDETGWLYWSQLAVETHVSAQSENTIRRKREERKTCLLRPPATVALATRVYKTRPSN